MYRWILGSGSMNKRWGVLFAIIWLAVIACLGAYSSQALFMKGKIQFDLLALLPEGQTKNMRLSNELMDDGNISGRLVITFGHENGEQAKGALLQFRERLKEVPLPILEHSVKQIEADYKVLFSGLYPYRSGLVSKDDRELLLKGHDDLLVNRALANIVSPFSSFNATQILTDPFGFYPRYVTSFPFDNSLQTDADGNLYVDSEGKTWYVFQGEVTEKIFSLKLQEKISESLLPLLSQIENETNTEVLRVGAAFYSAAGAQQAKNEISEIGFISTVGIILLLLLVFRSLNPILLALTVISTGLIGGLAACLFIFGSVHILALVFGCSLVGVAVDYAIHYYCASFKAVDRFQILRLLLPAMPLGVLTSSIGYGALILAPFPGIQQMAVLACVGLLCTFISVAVLGPFFIRNRETPVLAEKIQSLMERLAGLGSVKFMKPTMIAVLLSFFGVGFLMMSFDDNVRNFQAMDPHLKEQEESIKTMLKFNNSTKFLAISDVSLELILQTEEAITEKLCLMGVDCRALSDLIPSQKRQKENSEYKLKFSKANFPKIAAVLDSDQTFSQKEGGFDDKAMVADIPFIRDLPTGWKELAHVDDEGLITGRIMINGKVDVDKIGNFTRVNIYRPCSRIFVAVWFLPQDDAAASRESFGYLFYND